MRFVCALVLAALCPIPGVAQTQAFYVVDLRHAGGAALHTASRSMSAGAELPYVLSDSSRMACCFRVGSKPGAHKSSNNTRTGSGLLFDDEDNPLFEFSGYLVGKSAEKADRGSLGFGLVGMTAVKGKGMGTWEVSMGQGAGPVIVRQCTGAEGMRFRLYRGRADGKPFAGYYFALGYDTEPSCR
jgi:hypothetical protein